MLLEAEADDYLEKSVIMPDQRVNLLPMLLEDVLCRIRRKRDISLPTP
jgi:hypothetical protein